MIYDSALAACAWFHDMAVRSGNQALVAQWERRYMVLWYASGRRWPSR